MVKVSPSCSGVLGTLGASVELAVLATLGAFIGDDVMARLLADCFLFLARSNISPSERVTIGVFDLVDMVFSWKIQTASVRQRQARIEEEKMRSHKIQKIEKVPDPMEGDVLLVGSVVVLVCSLMDWGRMSPSDAGSLKLFLNVRSWME